MMKDKKIVIAVAAVAILLIAGIGFTMVGGKSKNVPVEESVEEEIVIETLKPEDLDLEISMRSDNRGVKFTIGKASDIKTVEFDAVYEHKDNPGENIYDQIDLEGEDTYESKYYDLGTCSSGTCRYHIGVEKVQFIFKITKTDGKIFQVEDSISL